jgi:hypothetical protein
VRYRWHGWGGGRGGMLGGGVIGGGEGGVIVDGGR